MTDPDPVESLRVVVAGGGTAGHIEPALNLADALRRRYPAAQITALGTARGLETTLVPARGYPLELIPAVPLPRRPSRDLLSLPGRLKAAVGAAGDVLVRTRADVVVGFGGYVALPAYLAARRAHVPIVVHEANAKAGLANRVGARFTPYRAETVAGSLRGARRIGLPLRPIISGLDRTAQRAPGRAFFGLDPDRPTLLVFGGSQGARRLNAAASGAAPALAAAGVQVLHVIGPTQEFDPPAGGEVPYVVLPYVERMDLAYAAADLALCRAGAMTCAELTAVGLPAIYVPLPIGNGEQRFNALPIVAAGGGFLVADDALSPRWLSERVISLLGDPEFLAQLGAGAATVGLRDADEALCSLVLEAVASNRSTKEPS